MITIEENTSKLLGGNTSLHVSFTYKPEIVEELKTLTLYAYNKKDHTWEFPLNELAELIDILCRLDDVKLKFINHTSSEQYKPMLDYKLKPYPYQYDGITFGLNNDNWLLLDDMGLGKTAQIIGLARELKAHKGLCHCLIICGLNALKTNWEKEIAKHSNESCIILGKRVTKTGSITYDTIEKRAEQLLKPIEEFFIITNVETLRDERIVKALQKNPNHIDMCVVDEIHKCKGTNAIQSKHLLSLNFFKYKVAATGTLIMNNPLDAYIPLKWIGHNQSSLTNYKMTYCVLDTHIKGRVIGFKNIDLLKEQIEECSLRRTKAEIFKELPEKNIIDEYIDLEPKHQQFYEAVVDGVKDEKMKVDLKPNNLLAMITRLRQATVSPTMLTTEEIQSTKISRAIELIREITSHNEKVVVFSNFKEPCYYIASLLEDLKPLVCTGDSKEDYLSQAVDEFQTNDINKVLIATTAKMGTGVTLTRASYCIFLDQPYTYALYSQAYSRIYRIGTQKPVFIYNLIAANTIDERIAFILRRKEAVSNYIIDDSISNDEELEMLKKYIVDL